MPTPIRGTSPFIGPFTSPLLLTPTSMSSDQDAYDIPKPATPVNYDTPRPWNRSTPVKEMQQSRVDESYDIPRAVTNLLSQHNSTPSSSISSLLTSDSFSLSSSNRSSLANMPDYDIPRRNPQSVVRATPPLLQTPSTPLSTYDIPLQMVQHTSTIKYTKKELPLELSSALETLDRLQTEATTAVTRLLSFVTPNWRTPEKLDPILMDLKLAAVRLRTALHDLSEFGEGALGNASKADDKNIATKLKPLVKALKDADKLVHDASHCLDVNGWTVESLQRTVNTSSIPPDSLDQLIACAQTLTEDVRQSASFIQGNSTLLFKRQASSPTTPTGNNNAGQSSSEWLEDYDYVSLETKEALAKKNAEIRDALPQDLQKNFENIVKNAESAAASYNEKATELDANDKSLLIYYTTQTVTHMGYLQQAIDAFLETVERNQPPKIFLAYGKFVVLSAHNLVNIGDIVHRNVSLQNVKTRILSCADALSDALKQCVAKTKKAAQHFPSVNAVQEMVDSVVDISHLARDLKIAMLQTIGPVIQQQ